MKLLDRIRNNEPLFSWLNIIFGCFVAASAYPLFMTPHNIAPGGLTGVAIILNYLSSMILKPWQKAVLVENDQIHLKVLTMEEEEFNIPANAFKKIPFVSKELETDGLNLQHAGVLDNFARKILYDEPFLFEGENGLNSLLLCNAIYLSSFLKQTIQFPFDEALYYELLKEKIVSSG